MDWFRARDVIGVGVTEDGDRVRVSILALSEYYKPGIVTVYEHGKESLPFNLLIQLAPSSWHTDVSLEKA